MKRLIAILASLIPALVHFPAATQGNGLPAADSEKFTPGPPPPPPDKLVYTPLAPCRLIDTRGFGAPIQGGAFLPNTRRSYDPAGLCGVPTADVYSMMVSFTTQNLTPLSGGYLALLKPLALVTTTVDVFNFGSEWSASNTVVGTGTGGQFDAFVANATAHLVVDILGYFTVPPLVTGADIADSTIVASKLASGSMPAGPTPNVVTGVAAIPTGATTNVYSGVCTTGTTAIPGYCHTTAPGMQLVSFGPAGTNQWRCTYRNDSGTDQQVVVGVYCLPAYAAPK